MWIATKSKRDNPNGRGNELYQKLKTFMYVTPFPRPQYDIDDPYAVYLWKMLPQLRWETSLFQEIHFRAFPISLSCNRRKSIAGISFQINVRELNIRLAF